MRPMTRGTEETVGLDHTIMKLLVTAGDHLEQTIDRKFSGIAKRGRPADQSEEPFERVHRDWPFSCPFPCFEDGYQLYCQFKDKMRREVCIIDQCLKLKKDPKRQNPGTSMSL